jgi:putative transposase
VTRKGRTKRVRRKGESDGTIKYEDIYLWRYEAVPQLQQGLGRYFPYDNEERLHQALDYQTPGSVYRQRR